jgi:hypothetical protein
VKTVVSFSEEYADTMHTVGVVVGFTTSCFALWWLFGKLDTETQIFSVHLHGICVNHIGPGIISGWSTALGFCGWVKDQLLYFVQFWFAVGIVVYMQLCYWCPIWEENVMVAIHLFGFYYAILSPFVAAEIADVVTAFCGLVKTRALSVWNFGKRVVAVVKPWVAWVVFTLGVGLKWCGRGIGQVWTGFWRTLFSFVYRAYVYWFVPEVIPDIPQGVRGIPNPSQLCYAICGVQMLSLMPGVCNLVNELSHVWIFSWRKWAALRCIRHLLLHVTGHRELSTSDCIWYLRVLAWVLKFQADRQSNSTEFLNALTTVLCECDPRREGSKVLDEVLNWTGINQK